MFWDYAQNGSIVLIIIIRDSTRKICKHQTTAHCRLAYHEEIFFDKHIPLVLGWDHNYKSRHEKATGDYASKLFVLVSCIHHDRDSCRNVQYAGGAWALIFWTGFLFWRIKSIRCTNVNAQIWTKCLHVVDAWWRVVLIWMAVSSSILPYGDSGLYELWTMEAGRVVFGY